MKKARQQPALPKATVVLFETIKKRLLIYLQMSSLFKKVDLFASYGI
jgi:hypothetical protein